MASRSPTSPPSALMDTRREDEKRTQDESKSEHAKELATESDPHEDYDVLCELCGSLNIDTLVSDYGGDGKLYDLGALIDSASRCKTCERLFNLKALCDVDGAECDNSVSVTFEIRPDIGASWGVLEVETTDRSRTWREIKTTTIAEYTVFAEEGDVASLKHGLLALQAMGNNTSSAESFKTARRWVHNCTEGHQGIHQRRPESFRTYFGEPKFEAGNGPARLIDVFAPECGREGTGNGLQEHSALDSGDLPGDEHIREQTERSRIVDGVDILVPYLALSYRWGSYPHQGYVTTNANVLARRLDILEHELPKTLRHAIHVARRLGVRYLWIDALCIIQDSKEDWLEESGKMGSIFANAQLTLFAAAGETSDTGMFNQRSTYNESASGQRIALHTVLPGSIVSSTLHFVPSTRTSRYMWTRPHRNGPLVSRAWCLQEDLLSTRKLYYASDQLYWQCEHLELAEDNLTDPNRQFFPAPPSHNDITNSDSAWNASFVWYNYVIGDAYSKRVATKKTDRLIAVAGLARHVAKQVKSRYLAGLWEISVLEGLLWTGHGKKQKHNTYCTPSWSWASHDGAVSWNRVFWSRKGPRIIPGCQYLRADIELLGKDEYGGVSSAALTLCAKVVELAVEDSVPKKEPQLRFSASCQGVPGFARLDEEMSISTVRFLAILILHGKSLLVARIPGSQTHRRVGIWDANKDDVLPFPGGWGDGDPEWSAGRAYLRWLDHVLPTIPVTEITII